MTMCALSAQLPVLFILFAVHLFRCRFCSFYHRFNFYIMQLLSICARPWLTTGIFFSIVFLSCSTSNRGLFAKKSPHEKYADGLRSAGLQTSEMGRQWFAAAEKSLGQPLTVSLPYRETGYFAAEKPGAAGYRFTAKRGDRLSVKLTTVPATGALVFTELWETGQANEKPKLLEITDTTTLQLEYDVGNEAGFLVRLQPELLKGVEYTLVITTAPSLAFPVRSTGNPRIISFWGAGRDGGSRSHEGIDISAAFRTPVVAGADGRVTSVTENNLGGKVVFMRPQGKNYSLYYAHLDSQIATPGQAIKAGDVLGLVGNTGNARNTIPHLHFGIYASGGAIDPLPFVNPDRPPLPAMTAPLSMLNRFVRNNAAASLYPEPSAKSQPLEKLEANSALQVISAAGSWYKVMLPDQKEGFISSSAVTATPLRTISSKEETRLLDAPDTTAATKRVVPSGTRLTLLGQHGAHYLAEHENTYGWIRK